MEPAPLLEKVSSYSLLARLWLLDEPSFFSLAGYDRANNIIVLCYQFSTVARQVLLSFKTKLAEEKQNVTIACNVTGQPQPDIKWSKSGGTMPKSRNGVKNGVLTIYNVAGTDRGTYVCKAKNILGFASDTTLLVVFSPLRFKMNIPQEVTPYMFGSTVRLPCVAESDLKTTITWSRNGKSSLPVDAIVLQNNTLVLENFRKSHEGSYSCRANNAVTTIEAEVKINSPATAPASCSVIRKYVSSVSGNYVIDPDGEGGLAPFTVFCDMTDKNGVGVTVISHDSERRTKVRDGLGWGGPGSYSRDIHYTGASLSQLARLTRVSSHCEQFIKYECYGSPLRLYSSNPYGSWVLRDSAKVTYWGGASPGSGNCPCGMTNSCPESSLGCNCENDRVWREDSGLLTEKTKLPVKQLRFGDAGDSYNQGYHTLGKLKCYGAV